MLGRRSPLGRGVLSGRSLHRLRTLHAPTDVALAVGSRRRRAGSGRPRAVSGHQGRGLPSRGLPARGPEDVGSGCKGCRLRSPGLQAAVVKVSAPVVGVAVSGRRGGRLRARRARSGRPGRGLRAGRLPAPATRGAHSGRWGCGLRSAGLRARNVASHADDRPHLDPRALERTLDRPNARVVRLGWCEPREHNFAAVGMNAARHPARIGRRLGGV